VSGQISQQALSGAGRAHTAAAHPHLVSVPSLGESVGSGCGDARFWMATTRSLCPKWVGPWLPAPPTASARTAQGRGQGLNSARLPCPTRVGPRPRCERTHTCGGQGVEHTHSRGLGRKASLPEGGRDVAARAPHCGRAHRALMGPKGRAASLHSIHAEAQGAGGEHLCALTGRLDFALNQNHRTTKNHRIWPRTCVRLVVAKHGGAVLLAHGQQPVPKDALRAAVCMRGRAGEAGQKGRQARKGRLVRRGVSGGMAGRAEAGEGCAARDSGTRTPQGLACTQACRAHPPHTRQPRESTIANTLRLAGARTVPQRPCGEGGGRCLGPGTCRGGSPPGLGLRGGVAVVAAAGVDAGRGGGVRRGLWRGRGLRCARTRMRVCVRVCV